LASFGFLEQSARTKPAEFADEANFVTGCCAEEARAVLCWRNMAVSDCETTACDLARRCRTENVSELCGTVSGLATGIQRAWKIETAELNNPYFWSDHSPTGLPTLQQQCFALQDDTVFRSFGWDHDPISWN
jgi:hypothetical protein